MKKAAGYSMLFGAALLCVLLLNANVASVAETNASVTSSSSSDAYVKTWTKTSEKKQDGKLIEKSVQTWREDANGNREMQETIYDENGKVKEEKAPVKYTADEVNSGTSGDADKSGEEAEKAEIPDSAPMNLGIKENDFSKIMANSNFRGGNPDEEQINCLEDVRYEKQEHTIIYNPDTADLTKDSGAFYSSDPNMKWTVEDSEGNLIEQKNTNIATDGGEFFTPGEYTIGNSGARQVSTVKQDEDTKTETTDTKTVTSQQSTGVKVYDVTVPDVWVGLSEISEDKSEKEDEINKERKEMLDEMLLRIQATKKNEKGEEDADGQKKRAGRAVSVDDANSAIKDGEKSWLKDRNFVFVDEGVISTEGDENERDLLPTKKTERITTVGTMFNEDGNYEYVTNKVDTLLQDTKAHPKDDFTWLAQVTTSELLQEATKSSSAKVILLDPIKDENGNKIDEKDAHFENAFPGIFVKRGSSFVVAAATTDNGDRRKTSREVDVKIFKGDEAVPLEKGCYTFNTPNYPRADYPDQYVYTIDVTAEDADGNTTQIKLPLYVIDTHSSYSDNND